MIRLLMKSGLNVEIPKTRTRRHSITQNQVTVKDPVTGNRKFIGGNYVNFSFDVVLFNGSVFDNTLFAQLDSIRYQECSIEIDGSVISYQGSPYNFYITNVNPFYLNDWDKYEMCNIALGSDLWTPAATEFLIDDLNNYILTEDGQKIIIGK